MSASRASSPSEAVGQDAAPEIAPEFLFHMIGDGVAKGLCFIGHGEVGLQVFPDDAVKRGGLGPAPAIGLGMGAVRGPGRWCGPPGLAVSGAGLCGHRWSPASRGASGSISTSRTAEGWGGGMGKGALLPRLDSSNPTGSSGRREFLSPVSVCPRAAAWHNPSPGVGGSVLSSEPRNNARGRNRS
jgi:hypothetical protein